MRAVKSVTFNQGRDTQDQINDLDLNLSRLYTILHGRVRFGDGTDGDVGENIAGEFQTYTSNGSADTEDTIAHTVQSIPVGVIILHQDKAGSFYQGPTTGTNWTAATSDSDGAITNGNIYLKCSVTSVTVSLFLVK